MANTLTLDDYREVMTALDRADLDLLTKGGSLRDYCELVAEHVGKIRDAVENCLYRDHNRLGFASENSEAPIPVLHHGGGRPPGPRRPYKITPEEIETIRYSTGPARLLAEQFGISGSRVSEIRRGASQRN